MPCFFPATPGVELSDIYQTLVINYNNSNEFVKVQSAEFVVSSQLKSPMGEMPRLLKIATKQ
jgi:hypothetical protein